MWLLRTLPNNVLCHIGIRHGFKGANACITNHSIGGTLAVIEAMEALRTGEADRALAVGHDAPIEPQMGLYYHDVGLLAKGTIRPFDARRDGSLYGEGAAALALETEESARSRDAPILGEVLGGGSATDAQGLLAIRDDGDALARAIESALADAGIRAAEVGMIAAHGNGTPQSDASEAAAIRRVFGESAPPATAFKWAFGHLVAETAPEGLHRFFTTRELDESGEGAGRAASLAARSAAKEACVKLFPREAALGEIEPGDFSVARDAYGAPRVALSPRATAVLAKNRLRDIALSLTHDRVSASSVALAVEDASEAQLSSRLTFHLLQFRLRILIASLC